MRFERRSLPPRRDVIMRDTAVLLLAWILQAFPRSCAFTYAGDSLHSLFYFYPDDTVWVLKECGIVVLMAAIGAHVEKSRGRQQSNATMAVLAYVAARGPDRRSHLPGFPELLVAVPRVALAAARGLPPARRLSAGTGPAPALAGARTRCRLGTKIGGDLPDFSFPLQSWRSMGTC
jgi:hypothetical protein